MCVCLCVCVMCSHACLCVLGLSNHIRQLTDGQMIYDVFLDKQRSHLAEVCMT